MNTGPINFAEVFTRLTTTQQREETVPLSGVNVRMVHVVGVAGGGALDNPRWSGTRADTGPNYEQCSI